MVDRTPEDRTPLRGSELQDATGRDDVGRSSIGRHVGTRKPDGPRRAKHLLPALKAMALTGVLLVGACAPPPAVPGPTGDGGEWREFHGTWTAVGHRQVIGLDGERRASIASFSGTLVLAGPSRPGAGFRAEAIVMNDTATGMVGRAAWTDERGDQVYSELRGDGSATGNHVVGTFIGGTGRYAGATGTYDFSWRFVLEAEDGTAQGQSVGLKGRIRGAPVASGPAAPSKRP